MQTVKDCKRLSHVYATLTVNCVVSTTSFQLRCVNLVYILGFRLDCLHLCLFLTSVDFYIEFLYSAGGQYEEAF